MQPIRVQFKKEGRAKYISHLDLNRVMQRALRRAKIPVWITQGFNPHPYIVFAMPLSLFYESDCEIMDARLDGDMPLDEVKESLAAQMPQGIVITEVSSPELKLTEVSFATYHISFEFEGKSKEELDWMLKELLLRDDIIIEKSTKHRILSIDIKQYFDEADIKVIDGFIEMVSTLPAGSKENLNPVCFSVAFEKYGYKPEFENVRRIKILTEDKKEFE